MSWQSPRAGPLLCPSEEHAEASNVGSAKLGVDLPQAHPPWLMVLAYNDSPWCQNAMWHPDWSLAWKGTVG